MGRNQNAKKNVHESSSDFDASFLITQLSSSQQTNIQNGGQNQTPTGD
jgi:hypothetical protein